MVADAEKKICVMCGREAHERGNCVNCNAYFCSICFLRHTKTDISYKLLLGDDDNINKIRRKIVGVIDNETHDNEKEFAALLLDEKSEVSQQLNYIIISASEHLNTHAFYNAMAISFMLGYQYKEDKDKFENLLGDINFE